MKGEPGGGALLNVSALWGSGTALGIVALGVVVSGARAVDLRHQTTPSAMGLANWRPTNAPADAEYLKREGCAACHAQAQRPPHTGMSRASQPPAECEVLRKNPLLSFESGPYRYRIEREGDSSLYEVTDGTRSIRTAVQFCFGDAEGGQTYILLRDGVYHESRVSYYPAIKGLDFTIGVSRAVPSSLEEAVGRVMSPDEAKDCYGCHSTGAVRDGRFAPERLLPGVTCEGCHGPGQAHVEFVRSGQVKNSKIFNPASLSTEDLSTFCGACHRTWSRVVVEGPRGVGNVRFQPYRLAQARCYDAEDKRIACTACHDVHHERERRPGAYDAKCLACHLATKERPPAASRGVQAKVKACKTGKPLCTSCHMPKQEIPGSHFAFTDHRIRVARPGAPYPD